MNASFHPRLVNGVFEDPALFIALAYRKQALLFDLGDLYALSSREILKISHIFVTHTHMDHFIGFDRVLRLMLGRSKRLNLYGPRDFIANITGKLRAYSWNLLEKYSDGLTLQATEIETEHRIVGQFDFHNGFVPGPEKTIGGPINPVYHEPELTVDAVELDHRIPCLGFSVQERFHVNILSTGLKSMGLEVGPWISAFKALLYRQADPHTPFSIPANRQGTTFHTFTLGHLADQIAVITPGRKTAYVTDVVYSRANEEKIVRLSEKADYLFIEAAFLQSESKIARDKYHLTAHQAGTIARKAGARQLILFHHSPRYLGRAHLLVEEANQAFLSKD